MTLWHILLVAVVLWTLVTLVLLAVFLSSYKRGAPVRRPGS